MAVPTSVIKNCKRLDCMMGLLERYLIMTTDMSNPIVAFAKFSVIALSLAFDADEESLMYGVIRPLTPMVEY